MLYGKTLQIECKIMIKTREEAIEYLTWADDGLYEVIKKQDKSIRSQAQVRYYWKVVVGIIWDFHWLTPIETNESLKLLFKKDTFTDLDTVEFKFVIESIIEMWAMKYQVRIPTPENAESDNSLYKSLGF